jgi:MFS transporter, DHA2 family, multidrug resistance protein
VVAEAATMDIGWTPARSVAGGRNPWLIVGVISIATFMVVLDTTIVNVALVHIAGSLAASIDEASWVVTSFLIANAIIIPISGWLADVLGRKRYYMMSVTLFTISSLFCGLAPNLGILILARIFQGIGGGGLAPVEQSMLADTFPPEKRGLAIAAYGVVVIVAPIAGPTLGGMITDNISWHWVFLINLPFGALSLFLVSIFVDEPEAVRKRTREMRSGGIRIDYVGFALVAVFLGCLEFTLDRGEREDWFASPMITAAFVISAIGFLLLIPWELAQEEPIIALKLFRNRNFAVINLFMLLVGMIIFGTTLFIPQFLQTVLGYTATDAGMALTLGGVATIITMPLAGILTGRVDARILVGAAFLIQGFALWNMTGLDTQISFDDAAMARMWQSIGIPFLFIPITTVAYVGLRPEENNQASGIMNMVRNVGGSIGIAAITSLLAQREQFHQARYVETLNPLNPNYDHAVNTLSRALVAQGVPHTQSMTMAIAEIYGKLVKQTMMLSYIDAFHIMMIIIFATVPLVFLLRAPRKGNSPNMGPG